MKKSLADYQKNRENPFLTQAIERIEDNVVKKYKAATKTGESAILKAVDKDNNPVGHTSFIRQIEVDEEQFTKLYLSNFSAFFDLKSQSIKVFGYIMSCLLPNKDFFYFDREDCMEYTGYKSDKSIYLGLANLLNNDIIARGKSDTKYYINPMLFFNGNRITFAKTYIKKQKPKPTKVIFDRDDSISPKQTDLLDQIKEMETE